jgi:hypothetical protein
MWIQSVQVDMFDETDETINPINIVLDNNFSIGIVDFELMRLNKEDVKEMYRVKGKIHTLSCNGVCFQNKRALKWSGWFP